MLPLEKTLGSGAWNSGSSSVSGRHLTACTAQHGIAGEQSGIEGDTCGQRQRDLRRIDRILADAVADTLMQQDPVAVEAEGQGRLLRESLCKQAAIPIRREGHRFFLFFSERLDL
jgi:hypothetical protein